VQWDEGIQTMSVGEVATLTIEPEWAYGKKGVPEAYPLCYSFIVGLFL
jgi:FKBP-type peptidyl-prolyl cis-trans isomerase